MRGPLLGNPHSVNPTSSAATALVEQARAAVLRYFNADEDTQTQGWALLQRALRATNRRIDAENAERSAEFRAKMNADQATEPTN